jgi:hypothetical protein
MGRKSLNNRPMTSTKRVRRHRARNARTQSPALSVPLTSVTAGGSATSPLALQPPATEYSYSEVAREILGVLLDKFNEALRRNDPTSAQDFVRGHRVGVEQCISIAETHRAEIYKMWGKPIANLRPPRSQSIENVNEIADVRAEPLNDRARRADRSPRSRRYSR